MNRTRHYITLAVLALCISPSLSTAQAQRQAWANVIEARPVRQQVRIPVENQVCWDEQVVRAAPTRRSAAPRIFGAIIGGVVGHQFGGGSGQDIMTAAGAVVGASVASEAQYRKYPDRYYQATEQRCETRTEWRYEDRIVAWDVTYEFNGEQYRSQLQQAPGDRIRIQVGVQPLEP